MSRRHLLFDSPNTLLTSILALSGTLASLLFLKKITPRCYYFNILTLLYAKHIVSKVSSKTWNVLAKCPHASLLNFPLFFSQIFLLSDGFSWTLYIKIAVTIHPHLTPSQHMVSLTLIFFMILRPILKKKKLLALIAMQGRNFIFYTTIAPRPK